MNCVLSDEIHRFRVLLARDAPSCPLRRWHRPLRDLWTTNSRNHRDGAKA